MKVLRQYLIILMILLNVGFVFYHSRQIFFFRYEPEYYENWYYHSQWNIPNSTRGISDGDLYKFIGYKIIEGENPFNINFEVPPFGKSLYGLAEKYIKNPYIVSGLLYLMTLGILYALARLLTDDKELSLMTVWLFTSTPFVATQVRETMLDLPLMFLFLVNVYFFISYLKSEKLTTLIWAGIFLGLASGTKVGVYSPLVLLIGEFILVYSKKFKQALIYLLTTGGGYMLSYYVYFLRHPNPLPWLRLHRKIYDFYLKPETSVDYLNQWRSVFLNSYQGFWENGLKTSLGDWSPLLPVGVMALAILLVRATRERKLPWIYISGFGLSIMLVNTFLPFFPRYLMPVIPALVISTIILLKKRLALIGLLILVNVPFLGNSLIVEGIEGEVQAQARFFSTTAYREMYRSLSPKQQMSESSFIDEFESLFNKLDIQKIEIKAGEARIEGKRAKVDFQINYLTKYGIIKNNPQLEYERVHNQWKLRWNWNYVLKDYESGDELVISNQKNKLINLVDKQGKIVASRGDGLALYIVPRLMFDWSESLDRMSKITGIDGMVLDKRIKEFVPDKYLRPIGFASPCIGQEKFGLMAQDIPGMIIKQSPYFRIREINVNECDEIYAKIIQLNSQYPQLNFVEADVLIKKKSGQSVKIEIEPIENYDQEIRLSTPLELHL